MSPKRNKRARIRPGLKQRRFRQRLISYREAKGRPAFRRIPRAAVPSFFTLMNLFCGFLSLIQVYDGNLENAAWLIILAGFFDGLDGMMARLTNGTSLFGVELDSLSDVVSFGVAPSFLIWAAGLSEMGTTGVIIASLPALAGAIRLARFNISFEGTKGDYFSGLPIPVSAAVIVAIILNEDLLQDLFLGNGDLRIVTTTVILLAGLMVSTIPFDSFPQPSAAYIRKKPLKAILGVASLGILVVFREPGLLVLLIVYLGFGIGRSLTMFFKALRDIEPAEDSGSKE
ncbi:MAG: CDP-diacylglycerol--serine O-phosphatidyltransferase [Bacteroidetes bacterium]|nr:CDP-diacylglycerol--serine O-phosphatidyltransferase [Bacteroidota bacterium]MDA1333775.1 CDP-diacylglycerol--serine O-phosphatidyltransferase [Bacteroidota bacterium]